MRHGDKVHISELKVGDVVRMVNGPNPQGGGEVGGERDFREGYDTMTVTAVTEDELTFERPYVHVYENGLHKFGVEKFKTGRTGGYYYERLNSLGPSWHWR